MRLIDADALDVLTIIGGRMDGKVKFAKAVNEMIQNAPTVDAVPVIRCKDCKHSEPWYADKRRCFLWSDAGIDVFEDGFCNYAERKEE